MDIYSKSGVIFIVEVDHISGECVGQSIDCFYSAGASNVQVISAITKKNRPSYVFLIDCKKELADEIESTIAGELATGGWHRIDTTHRYLHNRIIERPVKVISGAESFEFIVKGKEFDRNNIRPEHDNVIELRKMIAEKLNKKVTYSGVFNFMVSVLFDEKNDIYDIL